MKVSDVLQLKNKPGTIFLAGVYVDIQILDIREVFGNIQYLVSPMAGSGSVWVAASRVEVLNEIPAKDGSKN